MVETRPSGAGRWYNCAAAPQIAANAKRKPPEGDPAREGTCAAWLADLVISGNVFAASHMTGELHPENGWPVDQEMADHVQNYCDMIRERGGVIEAEKFVRLSDKVAGTMDCAADLLGNTLYVDDLKFGYKIVEAKDNKQLLCYAAALLALMTASGRRGLEYVQVGIYQPRAHHHLGTYRTHVYTVQEVEEWGRKLIAAAEECHKPNPVATPGSWCLDCNGALECVALQHSVWAGFEVVRSAHQANPSGEQLAKKYAALKEIKKMTDALFSATEAEITARRSENSFVPGYTLARKLGPRKINVSARTFEAITGVDPRDDSKMLSLAELKRRGVTEKQLNLLTNRSETNLKLVEMSDLDISAQFGKED